MTGYSLLVEQQLLSFPVINNKIASFVLTNVLKFMINWVLRAMRLACTFQNHMVKRKKAVFALV